MRAESVAVAVYINRGQNFINRGSVHEGMFLDAKNARGRQTEGKKELSGETTGENARNVKNSNPGVNSTKPEQALQDILVGV